MSFHWGVALEREAGRLQAAEQAGPAAEQDV
jgi:hypothetical protein